MAAFAPRLRPGCESLADGLLWIVVWHCRSCTMVRENSQMQQRHVLFLLGPQVCVPEDPLAAAKQMGLRTSVMAREMPCGASSNLVDHFEKVGTYQPDEIV